MIYVHFSKIESLPNFEIYSPYKCVLVVEDEISNELQNQISELLVSSGCMYMMAWGVNCSCWDDSVDEANLKKYDYNEVPEEGLVITTWHEKEALKEVFSFSKESAFHGVHKLEHCVILHLSKENKEQEFNALYNIA